MTAVKLPFGNDLEATSLPPKTTGDKRNMYAYLPFFCTTSLSEVNFSSLLIAKRKIPITFYSSVFSTAGSSASFSLGRTASSFVT
jgi:hypothetical protein